MKRLRAVPPLFLLAIVGELLFVGLELGWRFASTGELWIERLSLTSGGLGLATRALAAAGIWELARRASGRARKALLVSAIAFLAGIVFSMGWNWLWTLWHRHESFETLWKIESYAQFTCDVVAMTAFAIAAWSAGAVAIAGLVLALASHPPPFAYDWILSLIGNGDKAGLVFEIVVQLLLVAGMLLLAIAVASGEANSEPHRAAAGLRQVAASLKLRVVGVLVGAGLTILVILGSNGGEGALGALKLAMFSQVVLYAIAQVMMSLGAMRASSAAVPDLPRWACALAAALALWCTGVVILQVPRMYNLLYGEEHGFFRKDSVEALSLALPLVVAASVAVVAAAISALAARRGDEQLRMHASGKGVGFAALIVSSIGITTWVVPHAKSDSGYAMMLVCAGGALLWAFVLAAKLCALGADAVEAEPGLPAAKVV